MSLSANSRKAVAVILPSGEILELECKRERAVFKRAICLCPGSRVQQGGYCQKSICYNVRSVALGIEESMLLTVCLTVINENIQLKCAKGLKQPGQMSSKPGICFWMTIRGRYIREGTPAYLFFHLRQHMDVHVSGISFRCQTTHKLFSAESNFSFT